MFYAKLERSSTGIISCLKWCNPHMQMTVCYGSVNHSGNGENKHEVTFQLAAVYLNSSTLMVQHLCEKYRILKDNSWMCILHQYHKASGLKVCTAMCQEREELSDYPIWWRPQNTLIFCKFSEGIWNNYVNRQQKNMQVRFIMILDAWGYNSFSHSTLHYKVWSSHKCV